MTVDGIPQVAVAVVEHQGRFLVGVRGAGQTCAGLAEFPGGRVEPGETAEAAAVRECREETGLEIRTVGFHDEVIHRYPHGPVHLHFFACEPADARVIPRDPFRWLERSQLAECTFPPANAALLHRLLSATS